MMGFGTEEQAGTRRSSSSSLQAVAARGVAGWARQPVGPAVYVLLGALYVVLMAAGSASTVNTLELIAILAVFATGTNVLVGQVGLMTFGQAAFYGTAAYTLGILLEHGIPFAEAFMLAVALSTVAAIPVGFVLLRTRNLYFSLASLVVSQLAYTAAESAYSVTGGDNGLFGVSVPGWLTAGRSLGWFITLVAAVVIVAVVLTEHSSLGLLMRSARENRTRLRTLGLVSQTYELAAFTLSGAVCAVAGCLAFLQIGGVTPKMLTWTQSAIPVLAVVIGGMGAYGGPIIGAAIYEIIYTTAVDGSSNWELIFGALLVVIVLIAPEGIVRFPRRARSWIAHGRSEWVEWRARARS